MLCLHDRLELQLYHEMLLLQNEMGGGHGRQTLGRQT